MYVLLLASLLSFGALFTHFFFAKSPWYVKLSLWFFSGAILLSWLLFIATLFVGYEGAQIIALSFGAGNATFLAIRIGTRKSQLEVNKKCLTFVQNVSLDLRRHKIGVGLFLVWSGIFTQLAITHNFMYQSGELISGGGAYGDLALHASFVHYFAFQPTPDLTSPIYATEQTTYPFLLNFLASQFLRAGMTLQQSLILTSLPFILIFLIFLWHATRAAGGKTLAWALASIFFLLNGGIGFHYFIRDWQASSNPLTQFLLNQPHEYAHLIEENLRWSNVIADSIIPQRSIILGLGLAALSFAVFFRAWKNRAVQFPELLGTSFLIGLIPFFHIHTFISLFPLIAWCSFWLYRTNRITNKQFAILVFTPLFLAAPQLYWQFFHTFSKSFMRVQLGWLSNDTNVLIFWLRNWGASTVLWLIGVIALINSKKLSPVSLILFPLFILFIITNVVIFQPHDYDNLKLMFFVYLAVCISSAIWLEIWVKQNKIKLTLLVIFTIVAAITGALSVVREMTLRWSLADEHSQRVAHLVRTQTDPTQIFLTADSHNHPVPMLAGRKVLLGYRGWLWTHGVDYSQVEADTLKMFAGGTKAVELLQSYKIGYVFIGPIEKEQYRANTSYFESHFEKVVSDPSGSVYRIHSTQAK